MLLDNIRLFTTIADRGSLVAAARQTGLSTTTVSDRLAALEAHYGVILFHRTTRSISLTDEGRTLLEGARALLTDVDDLDARIRQGARTLSGPVRISAPVDIGRNRLSDILAEFTSDHPAISIELSLSDGYVDIIRQGVDIALRFGSVADSTLRARKLGAFRRIVCAAPSYVAARGTPQHPEDLRGHNCLVMRFGDTPDNVWNFMSGRKPLRVTVHGNRVVNDGALVRRWALAGQGVSLKSELDVAEDISSGRLVALLEGFEAPPVPLQMLFPPSRTQPRRVTALAAKIAERMRQTGPQNGASTSKG